MRAIRSVPVSLLTLVILMPNARAQEQQLPVTLVQTANPITRSHWGEPWHPRHPNRDDGLTS